MVGYHFSPHICISNKCWWSGQNRKVWINSASTSTRFLLGKFLNKTQLNEPWSVTECYTCEIIKGKIRTVFPANFCLKSGGDWTYYYCPVLCWHRIPSITGVSWCHAISRDTGPISIQTTQTCKNCKEGSQVMELYKCLPGMEKNDFSSIIVF